MILFNNLLYILLICVVKIHGFSVEALHNYMTEPELEYYFQTNQKDSVPEYEIVYLPMVFPTKEAVGEDIFDEEIDYAFTAFQQPISLKLKRNKNIVSPNFKTYILDGDQKTLLLPNYTKSCHYLHKDSISVAAISICQPNSVQGIILRNNSTLEVHPLTTRLQTVINVREPLIDSGFYLQEKVPHIIKKASAVPALFDNYAFPTAGNVWKDNLHIRNEPDVFKRESHRFGMREAASHRPVNALTLEIALFFDEAAYKIFAPFYNYDEHKLQDMLLAYINGVQALYHQPSLGTFLEIVLVRLDIMKNQPSAMHHYYGERSKLLDSFCDYQSSINPPHDSNPDHWDMALYISGLDFYAYENGKKNGATMGLASVGGVCYDKYACIIAELGTTNNFGKPYPSAGFTSVYILAHEIGHNLGMHHDSLGNNCPKEGYVMSPSRGTNGETQWSYCSAEVMSKLGWAKCLQDSAQPSSTLDHSKFYDNPGQIYTAKKQCELLLRDKDAIVVPNQVLSTICYNLQCKTPHRSGYYFAGPALEGTHCSVGKYCVGGECLSITLPTPTQVIPGGWGPWKEEGCSSGCIEKSRGFQTKRRQCNNPPPVNTDLGCEGSSVEFQICKDSKICRNPRRSVEEYASQKCREFSRLVPELDPKGAGLQAPHEEVRVWMGCAIFCKRGDSGTFYTPRIELNDLGVSPYFPDGTWCHYENNLDYYCIHHHCLPENFVFTKSSTSILYGIGEDIPFSQNAHPHALVPPDIQTYLSLGPDGKPLQKVLKPNTPTNNDDWEAKDYVEVPELENRMKQSMNENDIYGIQLM